MRRWLEEYSKCELCDRFWQMLGAQSDAWEIAASNSRELWDGEPGERRRLLDQAGRLVGTDPAAAFTLYQKAADAGSLIAIEWLGWMRETGSGTDVDQHAALTDYHRAADGGSWTAFIRYARLLEELGYHAESDEILEIGIARGYVPAYYWLAYHRRHRPGFAGASREVRGLLEHAAAAGHPEARSMLARMMVHGKFGWHLIPRGARMAIKVIQGVISFDQWKAHERAQAATQPSVHVNEPGGLPR